MTDISPKLCCRLSSQGILILQFEHIVLRIMQVTCRVSLGDLQISKNKPDYAEHSQKPEYIISSFVQMKEKHTSCKLVNESNMLYVLKDTDTRRKNTHCKKKINKKSIIIVHTIAISQDVFFFFNIEIYCPVMCR